MAVKTKSPEVDDEEMTPMIVVMHHEAKKYENNWGYICDRVANGGRANRLAKLR